MCKTRLFHIKSVFRAVLGKVLDFVFPARCVACGRIISGADGLCPDCFMEIELISEPKCRVCGRPFEFSFAGRVCEKCAKRRPAFDKCSSAVIYNAKSKEIILPFKHADKTWLAKFMAGMMLASGRDLARGADAIIPVPIHPYRMLKRKYNQAGLIAKFIGKGAQKPVLYTALSRARATESQGRKTGAERMRNIKGAFKVKYPAAAAGKAILLIDDVLTTGATASECAKALKDAGARRVYVLTFARTRK